MFRGSAAAFIAALMLTTARAWAGETIIDSFNDVSAWTKATGPECTGTTTSALTSGPGYAGNGALLSYDFTKATPPAFDIGCTVVMTRNFTTPIAAPAALAFWVLSPPDAMFNLQVEDQTGQWLTYHVSRPFYALDITQWYQHIVELDAPSAWTGSGVIQGTIQAIAIAVQNRASYRVSGTVSIDELGSFDAIGGAVDPFGALSPAPTGSGDIASTLSVNVYQNAQVVSPMADAGFQFVRADLRWADTENPKGTYTFTVQDTIQQQLDMFGMKALWVMGGGNPLYGDCPPNPDGGSPTNGCAPESPASVTGFGNWAMQAAAHFKGKGDRFEIWNEPANSSAFKWPDYTGLAYAPVLNAGITGIHMGDPSAMVTCGGLASPGSGTPVWPGTFAWSFLTTYLDAGGGAQANAVAFHPYRLEGAETVTDDLVLARSILKGYFPTPPEIWNTEWGYTVADDSDAGTQGALAWQALYDVRLLLATRAMGFGLSNVFSADFPGYTILDGTGAFEPASTAVSVLTKQLAGRTFMGFVPAIPTSLHVLRFDRTADALVVLWSDAPNASVRVALPAPALSAVDEMGKALALVTANGVVTVPVTETSGPVYVTLPWPAGDAGVDGGPTDASPDGGATTPPASRGCGCETCGARANSTLSASFIALAVGLLARRRKRGILLRCRSRTAPSPAHRTRRSSSRRCRAGGRSSLRSRSC